MKTVDLQGREVKPDDPTRVVWWANCGYWTDDWDRLDTTSTGGIPVCPRCGCPGFIGSAGLFLGGTLDEYDATHPGYAEFIRTCKERCMRDAGGLNAGFQWWLEERTGTN